jgi:hypothetical protein
LIDVEEGMKYLMRKRQDFHPILWQDASQFVFEVRLFAESPEVVRMQESATQEVFTKAAHLFVR